MARLFVPAAFAPLTDLLDRFVPDERPVMFDADGVLACFNTGMARWTFRIDGIERPVDSPDYWFQVDTWGMDKDLASQRFDQFVADGEFGRLPELPGALDAVRLLIDLGQPIHVLTARPEAALSDTYEWLDERLGTERRDRWTIECNDDKGAFADRFSAAIDDKYENVRDIAAGGCGYSVIVDRTWNRHCPPVPFRHADVTSFVAHVVARNLCSRGEIDAFAALRRARSVKPVSTASVVDLAVV